MMLLAPAAMIALRARFVALKASRRLSLLVRIPFGLTILLLAAVALLAAGVAAVAAVIANAVVLNAPFLTALSNGG